MTNNQNGPVKQIFSFSLQQINWTNFLIIITLTLLLMQ